MKLHQDFSIKLISVNGQHLKRDLKKSIEDQANSLLVILLNTHLLNSFNSLTPELSGRSFTDNIYTLMHLIRNQFYRRIFLHIKKKFEVCS